jgi:uncharacterized membrane protein
MILYTILFVLYLFGLTLCYRVASKNKAFVEEFTELPLAGAWFLFVSVLALWPVVFALGVVSKLISKEK